MALLYDGDLQVWGCNNYGQLGDGTNKNRNHPKSIMKNVRELTCGYAHSMAITNGNQLYIWDANGNGQVNEGTTTTRHSPVMIANDVKTAAATGSSSIYVTNQGQVYTAGLLYWYNHSIHQPK